MAKTQTVTTKAAAVKTGDCEGCKGTGRRRSVGGIGPVVECDECHGTGNHIPDEKNERFALQIVSTDILARAARGEIDLNALARQQLANRGLDWQGKWIGFDRARELATLVPVRGRGGRVIAVSVPE